MIEYPEHEKLKGLNGKNQIIGDFIEYLNKAGLFLCFYDADDPILVPTNRSTEQILANYFDIDEGKLEEERRTMLEEIREI